MTEDRNKQYRNTVKDLLVPNTINQKDEKPHTAGLNEYKLPKYRLKKSSIPLQYRKPPCPSPCCWRGDRKFGLKTSNYILVNIIIATIKLSSFNVKMLKDMCGYFKIPYKSRDLKISWRPFSQGFRTCKGMWMQQKIISFYNFTVRELECLVSCPMLYDKLHVRSALVII